MSTTIVFILLVILQVYSKSPSSAPSLPVDLTSAVYVSTIQELQGVFENLTSNTVILLQPGVYTLSSIAPLSIEGVANVQLRGSTGNFSDIMLSGCSKDGTSGILINASSEILISDISISNTCINGILLLDSSNIRIYHCNIFDANERLINSPSSCTDISIEYCEFLFPKRIGPKQPKTFGISVIDGIRWNIRDNLLTNMYCASNLCNAISFGGFTVECVVERNKILGYGQGIILSNGDDSNDASVPVGYFDVIIRNNVLIQSKSTDYTQVPIAIDGNFTKVLHNTIYDSSIYANAIEVLQGVSSVEIYNNLMNKKVSVPYGVSVANNIVSRNTTWFVNISSDLNIRQQLPFSQVISYEFCVDDFEGYTRKNTTDVGAYLWKCNCEWTEWQTWYPCNVTCGSGIQLRKRTQLPAKNGGLNCTDSPQQFFNAQSCTGQMCYNTDCNGYPLEPGFICQEGIWVSNGSFATLYGAPIKWTNNIVKVYGDMIVNRPIITKNSTITVNGDFIISDGYLDASDDSQVLIKGSLMIQTQLTVSVSSQKIPIIVQNCLEGEGIIHINVPQSSQTFVVVEYNNCTTHVPDVVANVATQKENCKTSYHTEYLHNQLVVIVQQECNPVLIIALSVVGGLILVGIVVALVWWRLHKRVVKTNLQTMKLKLKTIQL